MRNYIVVNGLGCGSTFLTAHDSEQELLAHLAAEYGLEPSKCEFYELTHEQAQLASCNPEMYYFHAIAECT